jgi:hypothetical protein
MCSCKAWSSPRVKLSSRRQRDQHKAVCCSDCMHEVISLPCCCNPGHSWLAVELPSLSLPPCLQFRSSLADLCPTTALWLHAVQVQGALYWAVGRLRGDLQAQAAAAAAAAPKPP